MDLFLSVVTPPLDLVFAIWLLKKNIEALRISSGNKITIIGWQSFLGFVIFVNIKFGAMSLVSLFDIMPQRPIMYILGPLCDAGVEVAILCVVMTILSFILLERAFVEISPEVLTKLDDHIDPWSNTWQSEC